MESWMVSVGIGLITYVSVFVTIKNKTEQNQKDIDELKRSSSVHNKEDDAVHGKMFEKIDKALEEIAKHKVQLANAPSMKDVDEKFVSKEMFAQMQKHMDEKIDTLGKSIEKSLNLVLSNQMDMANKIETLKENR